MATEKVMISEQILQDTADSIRTKLNTEDKIKPVEFAEKIEGMNIAPKLEKGFLIKEYNSAGYPTVVEAIGGVTSVPPYMFHSVVVAPYPRGFFESLKTIYLTNITSIGKGSFQNCENLILTELPNGLTSIGESAFNGCSKITITEIPNGVKTLQKNCFQACGMLTNIKLHDGISKIDDYAFYNCQKLTLEKLPNALTSIGNYAFNNCKLLALKNLNENLTTIGNYAFENCSELILTSLPNSLTSLGSSVFYKCSKAKIATLGNNLTTIGTSCFRESGIEIKKIPDSVTSLASYSFYICNGLTDLEIGLGLTKIESYLFQKSPNLSEVVIKGNVTSFGTSSFDSCSSLTKIVLPNITSTPTLSNKNCFASTPISSGSGYIYVPDTLVDSFKAASNWSSYAAQIKPISELEVSE